MNSMEEFVTLVREELGIPVTAADADRHLDELSGWDSVYLLWLMTTLERRTGRRISMPDVLEADSLSEIYQVAVRE